MTEHDAIELFQAYQDRPKTPKRKRTMSQTLVGRYILIFRNERSGVPFYMSPSGHKTEEWRESQTFTTAEDARDVIINLLSAALLHRPNGRPRNYPDSPWDREIISHAKSARIYAIERELPERWALNETVAKVRLDDTVDFPKKSAADRRRGWTSEAFYHSDQSVWPKEDLTDGSESADRASL